MTQSQLIKTYSAQEEMAAYRELEDILVNSPIFPGAKLGNLGLFLTRASLARILFMHDLYLKILTVPGCVIELGCHWGQNLALFSSFRSIYEPQNLSRKIVGFDTFGGYGKGAEQDGALMASAPDYAGSVSENYEAVLDRILDCHNQLGPRGHIKKHEIVKGDATKTLDEYLQRNPDTLISLIYFDIGLYEPTKKCLELIKDRVAKGSIIGLDHVAMPDVPGDGRAVMDVFGYRNCRFVRDPRVPYQGYFVIE
jgi:hypothetical protein